MKMAKRTETEEDTSEEKLGSSPATFHRRIQTMFMADATPTPSSLLFSQLRW
jgi:hypothetical protein